ncbi:hypothetical protein COL940_009537 [Colletotrichum noveboracense]|nr:hypothetical protein COL940_009537 [Colletotrichum noveboracense]
MPSHISVLPASTQVGKQTIRFLLQSEQKPLIRGFYRDIAKAPAEFTSFPNFQAVQGDIATGKGLDFTDSDAVLYIPPPTWAGTDQAEFAHKTATFVANALKRSASVRRGLEDNAGNPTEVRVAILTRRLEDSHGKLTTSSARESSLTLSQLCTKDIGQYCAETLLADAIDPSKRDISLFGPQHYSPLDVKEALEVVTGRKGEMILVPAAGLAEYWGKQIPEVHLPEFVKFIKAQLPGGVMAQDYEDGKDTVRCHTSLQEELREMLAQHE